MIVKPQITWAAKQDMAK